MSVCDCNSLTCTSSDQLGPAPLCVHSLMTEPLLAQTKGHSMVNPPYSLYQTLIQQHQHGCCNIPLRTNKLKALTFLSHLQN